MASQIKMQITPDGLQIQIVDDQKRPMFDSGSAVVKPYMRELLREIGVALLDVENMISLDGHTDRQVFGNPLTGYSNWELSADRANASRRELMAAGLPEAKLARVVGMGASVPYDPDNPNAAVNRAARRGRCRTRRGGAKLAALKSRNFGHTHSQQKNRPRKSLSCQKNCASSSLMTSPPCAVSCAICSRKAAMPTPMKPKTV